MRAAVQAVSLQGCISSGAGGCVSRKKESQVEGMNAASVCRSAQLLLPFCPGVGFVLFCFERQRIGGEADGGRESGTAG